MAEPIAATCVRTRSGSTCSSLASARPRSLDAAHARARGRPQADGDRHRLALVEQQRRQRRAGLQPVAARDAAARPHGVAELAQPLDVAAHRALADAEATGELRPRPVAPRLQQRQQLEQACGGLQHAVKPPTETGPKLTGIALGSYSTPDEKDAAHGLQARAHRHPGLRRGPREGLLRPRRLQRDHDHRVNENLRFVQLTPRGSACSICIGDGITPAEPGSVKGMQMVVDDIEAAREQLVSAGIEVSDVDHQAWGDFLYFSDPDGNGWAVQYIPPRD